MGNTSTSPEEKKLEARLKELDAQIDLLSARAQKLQADAQSGSRDAMERVQAKRDAVATKLSEFRSNAGAALEEIRDGVKNAFDDLASSVSEAQATFDEEEKK